MSRHYRSKLKMVKDLTAQHSLAFPEPPTGIGKIRRMENLPQSASRMGELRRLEGAAERKRRGIEAQLRSGQGGKGIKRYT